MSELSFAFKQNWTVCWLNRSLKILRCALCYWSACLMCRNIFYRQRWALSKATTNNTFQSKTNLRTLSRFNVPTTVLRSFCQNVKLQHRGVGVILQVCKQNVLSSVECLVRCVLCTNMMLAKLLQLLAACLPPQSRTFIAWTTIGVKAQCRASAKIAMKSEAFYPRFTLLYFHKVVQSALLGCGFTHCSRPYFWNLTTWPFIKL